MSNEMTIQCPHCGEGFELTEALVGPMLEAEQKKAQAEVQKAIQAERETIAAQAKREANAEAAAELAARDAAIAERDAQLKIAHQAELRARKATEEAEQAKAQVEVEVQRRVDNQRKAVAEEAARKARTEADLELSDVKAKLADGEATVERAAAAELAARKAKEAAEAAKAQTELDVQRQVDAMREQVGREAARKASEQANLKLAAAEALIAEQEAKLAASQMAEVEARRLRAEAEQQKRETELTVARRIDEERTKVRDEALREREDEHRLKLGEKDAQIRAMQEQVEEMRRKSAMPSQQLVGDIQEVDLLATLQEAFPSDRFERVKKGQRGADVLQTVLSANGSVCGNILWESKRTKNWSELWLGKLREDQREAKADLAALATETLPEGVSSFIERDGVWVMPLSGVVPVGAALRRLLLEVAAARRAGALAESTKDHIFTYLTSPQFRQRVSGIVEGYGDMRSDLDREKRATLASWNKREKQLERILLGMTGFYGDLQGIAGPSLPAVDGLLLSGPEDASEKPKLTLVNSDVGTVEATGPGNAAS
jgi:hypothetical protein